MLRQRTCVWCGNPLPGSTPNEWVPHGICPQCIAKGFPEEARGRRLNPAPVEILTRGEVVTLVGLILVILGFLVTVFHLAPWP